MMALCAPGAAQTPSKAQTAAESAERRRARMWSAKQRAFAILVVRDMFIPSFKK
jgi:hypothetical protein